MFFKIIPNIFGKTFKGLIYSKTNTDMNNRMDNIANMIRFVLLYLLRENVHVHVGAYSLQTQSKKSKILGCMWMSLKTLTDTGCWPKLKLAKIWLTLATTRTQKL